MNRLTTHRVSPIVITHTLTKGDNPMDTKEAPKCPSCGSKQVLFRVTKGFICRRCGHEWKK